MKYRIRMNANGRFMVERRRWFHPWHNLGWEEGRLFTFETSEAACKALLRAQEADLKVLREDKWTTVVEETK